MSKDYWEARYQSQDMPWEKGAPSPGLVDFLAAHPELPRGTVCVPGCGTGHDRPGAYITPEPPGPVVSPPPRGRGLTARLAALLSRRPPDAPVCDRQHCAKHSRQVVHDWTDGAGSSITYRFCSKRCRKAWRTANGL